MLRIFFVCFGLIAFMAVHAQTGGTVDAPVKANAPKDSNVFARVEVESEFPGGIKAWQDYLSANIRYPEDAIKRKIEGTVVVQFVVTKEGKVRQVVIARSVHPSLDKEAIRLIKNSPDWVPARKNGRNVNSYKRQPIIFKLER